MTTTKNEPISPMWGSAVAEDIGSGFRAASSSNRKILLARAAKARAQKQALDATKYDAEGRAAEKLKKIKRRAGANKHPFLNGRSPFVYYVLKVNVKAKADKAKARRAPKAIVFDNPLSETSKVEFATKLKRNIDVGADFFWNEILPITNSVLSSLKKVDDFSNQATEEKAGLDTAFIKRKMTDAVNLRIIRHIAETMKLTKQERRLLAAEFYARQKLFG